MPSLRRIPDGAGDSGTMSNALKIVIDENGKETVKQLAIVLLLVQV